MGNPLVDYAADALKRAKTKYADDDKQFARPASPRPFPPLAPLAGNFANPSFGKTVLRPEGDALVLEIKVSGAKLKLDPWDGDIFTAKLMPTGRFAAVNEGPRPSGFVQFQIDKNGKLNLLRLSFGDGKRTSSAASNCSTTIKMRVYANQKEQVPLQGVTKHASRQRRPARSGKKIASHIQLIVGAVVFRDASRRHLQSSLDRRNTSRNISPNPGHRMAWPVLPKHKLQPKQRRWRREYPRILHFPGARVQLQPRQSRRRVRDLAFEQRYDLTPLSIQKGAPLQRGSQRPITPNHGELR
jgi:hypothetical protein